MTPQARLVAKLVAACLLCLALFAGLALLVQHFRKP
jgi:hypothetical protein